MPTILHIEDDLDLAELVRSSFVAFGFAGTFLIAGSVARAQEILVDLAKRGEDLDLIISDMNLPDGDGLELVREVRHHPAWKHTPILILSGDVDSKTVGRAYALGANAYVSKSPRGRSAGEVMKTLYEHWARDVILPAVARRAPLHSYLTNLISISNRFGEFYMAMVEVFRDDPAESEFWLHRALDEGNLINLFAFLQRQVDHVQLPEDLMTELQQEQGMFLGRLARVERAIRERPITTRDEAYARLLDYVAMFRPERHARAISHVFPLIPTAMIAARDMLAQHRADVIAWLTAHTEDPRLLERVAQLEEDLALLRSLPHGPARERDRERDRGDGRVRTRIETPR